MFLFLAEEFIEELKDRVRYEQSPYYVDCNEIRQLENEREYDINDAADRYVRAYMEQEEYDNNYNVNNLTDKYMWLGI